MSRSLVKEEQSEMLFIPIAPPKGVMPNVLGYKRMKGVTVADEREQTIGTLLMSTARPGMDRLIGYLVVDGFFTSPASTRFHRSCPGGLAQHSLGVCNLLLKYNKEFNLNTTRNFGQVSFPVREENLIIAGLLHDVCKIGAYLGSGSPYKWNRAQPKGHALLSLIRIAKYIEMEPIEELMIKFHMGTYGTFEFESYAAEYSIKGDKSKSKEERYGQSLRNAWYHNPIVKLIYFCDELEMFSK